MAPSEPNSSSTKPSSSRKAEANSIRRRISARQRGNEDDRTSLVLVSSVVLGVVAALVVAWLFVDPAPPNKVTIATGPENGFYRAIGEAYAKRLTDAGLEVVLSPSRGSVDNLARLEAGEVDVAFMQGGVMPDPAPSGLEALASVALEPLWIFTNGEAPIQRLEELAGRSVAVGPEGSGTRRLSMTLLRATDLYDRVKIDDRSGKEAVKALLERDTDAAFFVTTAQTATIRELMAEPRIHLAQLDRVEGFAMAFPYLSVVSVPEGGFDLRSNMPEGPTRLLAPATSLIAREGMHPAIVSLLLDAADKVGSGANPIADPDQFPSADYLELPLNEEAARYFEHGPTFLRRYLPFWAANLVERLWVLLIPLITVLIPLARVAPPAYRWQIRRRIYRWYDDLRMLEAEGRETDKAEELAEVLDGLHELASEVGNIRVPLAYTDDLYHLRLHIDFVIWNLDPNVPPGRYSREPHAS